MHEFTAAGRFHPCATLDPRYDTAITRNKGLRRSMHNNNNRLRRSSRSPVILFPFAVSALVAGVPIRGPGAGRSAGSGGRRHAVPLSARADRAAARSSTASPSSSPTCSTRLRSRFALEIARRPRRAARTRLVRAQPGVPRPRLQARRPLSVPYRRRARGARHAGRARAAADRRKRVRSRSRIRMAAPPGLWQIIPGTGKRLGLAQNWWFDGRRDVLESTRAALDYLEHLHERFDGDWLLAVAGYNSGEGNVARALKKAAAAGQPQDFWGIKSYLPAETRTYVPRLLAIAELVGNPAAVGVTLPELRNEAQFAVVETGGQIDMALAAQLAGIDTDALYALNPGVNRWATDPEGPHRLLLPLEQADAVHDLARSTRRARARAMDAAPRPRRRDGRRHRRALSDDRRGAARDQRAAWQFDPRRRLSDDPARQPVARKLHAERRCPCGSAAEHAAQRRAARARRANRRVALVDLARVRRQRAQSRELELDGAGRRAQHRAASSSSGPTRRRRSRLAPSAQASLAALGFGSGLRRDQPHSRDHVRRAPRRFACRRSHGASKCRSASSWSGTRAPPTSICSPANASRCSSTSPSRAADGFPRRQTRGHHRAREQSLDRLGHRASDAARRRRARVRLSERQAAQSRRGHGGRARQRLRLCRSTSPKTRRSTLSLPASRSAGMASTSSCTRSPSRRRISSRVAISTP